MLPTDAELNQMRDDLLDMTMPSTCTIQSATRTVDTMGGHVITWATAATAVHCRLDNITVREMISGGEVKPFTRVILTVPWDTVLTEANRIVKDSITYNVLSVKVGDWLLTKRAELEAV